VTRDEEADSIRNRLRLAQSEYIIALHAGAGGSADDMIERLDPIFREHLAPFATKHRIPIIDGGTTSGFVGMMGRARAATHGTFPLIGVMPLANAPIDSSEADAEKAELEHNHTHLVLVKGGAFGVESEVFVRLARALGRRPVALIINGGEIVRHEARLSASLGTPILVLEGSGRLADELIDAVKRGTNNEMLRATIEEGIIHSCTPDTLIVELKRLLRIP
jgi:hypothetical protein